jgi:DNA end-binding protein Ku
MLTAEFDPTQYRDDYREALLSVIESKVTGEAIAQAPAAQGKIVDLMEALRASVDAVKKDRVAAKPAPAEEEAPAAAPARRRKAG